MLFERRQIRLARTRLACALGFVFLSLLLVVLFIDLGLLSAFGGSLGILGALLRKRCVFRSPVGEFGLRANRRVSQTLVVFRLSFGDIGTTFHIVGPVLFGFLHLLAIALGTPGLAFGFACGDFTRLDGTLQPAGSNFLLTHGLAARHQRFMQLVATAIDENLASAFGFTSNAVALDRCELGRGRGAQLLGLLAISLVACRALIVGHGRRSKQSED